MNLNYTPESKADLDHIYTHIADDNPQAAETVIARILQAMSVLEKFPMIGRTGRIKDTREWSISGLPFVGVYTLANETEIDVIAIIHTSQEFPPRTIRL